MERNSIPGGRNRMHTASGHKGRWLLCYSLEILAAQACPRGPVTQTDRQSRQVRSSISRPAGTCTSGAHSLQHLPKAQACSHTVGLRIHFAEDAEAREGKEPCSHTLVSTEPGTAQESRASAPPSQDSRHFKSQPPLP